MVMVEDTKERGEPLQQKYFPEESGSLVPYCIPVRDSYQLFINKDKRHVSQPELLQIKCLSLH